MDLRASAARYSAMVRATRSSTESTPVTPDMECPALQMSRQRSGRFSRADIDIRCDIDRTALRQVIGIETRGGNGRPQHVGLQAGKGCGQKDIVGAALNQHLLVSDIRHAVAGSDAWVADQQCTTPQA